MPLTKRQREILTYLEAYSEEYKYAPSFEEIAEHFNYNSLATVHEHLSNLERKGYIKRSYNESRAIEILPKRAVRVPLMTRERFSELRTIRIAVEGLAVSLAAERFIDWFEGYLARREVLGREAIERALRARRRDLRHPLLGKLRRRLRRFLSRSQSIER